jgi:DNA topoisomerase VI subunit B
VLLNLLHNAVKFTDAGLVELYLRIKEKNKNAITVFFEVKDTGIGIACDHIKKIFDPFMQVESGTTRNYGGTGLGLTIAKNIVELMGGTISVESTPGSGSSFSFELSFDTVDMGKNEMVLDELLIVELFKNLEQLLRMGNPECRELIDSLRQIPDSGKLIMHMEDLDFELAHVSLVELKKELEKG